MRKLFVLIATLPLILLFVGCGSAATTTQEQEQTTNEAESQKDVTKTYSLKFPDEYSIKLRAGDKEYNALYYYYDDALVGSTVYESRLNYSTADKDVLIRSVTSAQITIEKKTEAMPVSYVEYSGSEGFVPRACMNLYLKPEEMSKAYAYFYEQCYNESWTIVETTDAKTVYSSVIEFGENSYDVLATVSNSTGFVTKIKSDDGTFTVEVVGVKSSDVEEIDVPSAQFVPDSSTFNFILNTLLDESEG